MSKNGDTDIATEIAKQFLPSISGHTAVDAETRSKPAVITYRVAWGIPLRRKFNLDRNSRWRLISAALSIYVAPVVFTPGYIAAFYIPYVFGASLLLLLCAMLLPDDKMYLDRLSFIIPSRNMFSVSPKVLWSKVEEVSIVDLAKSGKASRFALRMTEASGETHDLLLDALDKDSIPVFVEYMETYASHVRGLILLRELERFHDYQHHKLEGISYTQLWESSAGIQFGLTSFTPLAPGTVLQNSFKVVKQLAAGGFSAVYLVEDERNEKFVIKESVVPSNLDEALKAKAQEQFQREAKLLSRLNHSQVARVFDHFVEESRSYLRMQYIKGENLREHVAKREAVSEASVIRWMEELADILAYLHELEPPVVHRDLSPDNIVVTQNGRLVLIDFGAANEFIGQATGTLVGKHAYMAPEQIRGAAEPRSDLYSLGACAFFCLTGRDPEPIRRSSPKSQGITVTDWFDGFVRRATNLEKEERFQGARECLQYLKKPVEANAVSPPKDEES